MSEKLDLRSIQETITEQVRAYAFNEHLNAEQKQEALKLSEYHEQRCTTLPPEEQQQTRNA